MGLKREVGLLLAMLVLPFGVCAESSSVGASGANAATASAISGAMQAGQSAAPIAAPTITNQPLAPAVPTPEGKNAESSKNAKSSKGAEPSKGAESPKSAESPEKEQEARNASSPLRNEFQDFVAGTVGRTLPMFGYDLFRGVPTTFAPVDQIPVTADYTVGPGDEVLVRAWGQVDIDFRTVVDRTGNIYLPKVGNVNVAGIKYQDLQGYLKTAIGRVFRNFELNVNLGQLRSVQIFVVGQARRPGSYTVSSLSTLVNALFASGGPSEKGSMRQIELKRNDKVVAKFDVYDLLIKGDKSKDVRLLPGDVIYIPPVGKLVAIMGSVNSSAIYELKDKTTFADLLSLAGGFTTMAGSQKATLERIVDRKVRKVDEFTLDEAGLSRELEDGDIVTIFPISLRFDNAVRLQGNVAAPMRYIWHESMKVSDLLIDKNALIPAAYWQRQNSGQLNARYNKKEVNWDYAVIQRFESQNLTTKLFAFNLGKAIKGDPVENMTLQAGDIVTIFSAEDELPKTENDIVLQGSIFSPQQKRFVWRQGMLIRDLIPNAQWLIDYYDYWSNLKGGGLKSGINWDYANVVRLQPRDLTKTMITFDLGKAVMEGDSQNNIGLLPGDEVTVFTKGELAVPVSKQARVVRLEGEINAAGLYKVEPGETLRQLVARVGGMAPNAYLYGAEFTRESTRITQQKKMDEALDRMERDLERSASIRAQNVLSPEDATGLKADVESRRAVLKKLREIKATGRIILEMPPEATQIKELPDLALEDGDRFIVPAAPSTVSVIGAVYNENAFIHKPGKRVSDYLGQAGGITRSADADSLYVIRADGAVSSKRQSGWLLGSLEGERLMPGDTVVVPESTEKVSWAKELKDWTQILYQFGLGAAALKVLKD